MIKDRTRQRRGQGQAEAFSAPWGRTVKLVTAISLLIIVAVTVVPPLTLSDKPEKALARWLAPAIVLIVFGLTSLFSVRGFTVKGRELWIQRMFWPTRVPLHDLKRAYADSIAMKGSIRVAGNGGFLAFTGWFRNKKLGSYRAFVTDPARSVVMEFKHRKIVVSPGNPEAFIQALGVSGDPKRSGG